MKSPKVDNSESKLILPRKTKQVNAGHKRMTIDHKLKLFKDLSSNCLYNQNKLKIHKNVKNGTKEYNPFITLSASIFKAIIQILS